jgi:hypothetical protein
VFVLVACLYHFVDVRVTYLGACRAGVCRMKISEIFISFAVKLFCSKFGKFVALLFSRVFTSTLVLTCVVDSVVGLLSSCI